MSVDMVGGTSIRPDARCPKCGTQYGFLHSEPEYQPANDEYDEVPHGERLIWRCTRCGYRVETPTADAAVEAS